MLAATLYQGNPDMNHKLWNIVSTHYAGAAGMLLHINGKFTMGKLKSSLYLKSFVLYRPSLSISRCRSRYEAEKSFLSRNFGLGLGYLMPLSTIFELYRSGQFYWWRKPDKTITLVDIDKITDLLLHKLYNSS